jgi:hypothetical protein
MSGAPLLSQHPIYIHLNKVLENGPFAEVAGCLAAATRREGVSEGQGGLASPAISTSRSPCVRWRRSAPIPSKVAANPAYKNARENSDKQNARIEHDKALVNVIIGLMKDDTELFKQFSDNPEFKRWLADTIFAATYDQPPSVSAG